MESNGDESKLLELAFKARKASYSPYSEFSVGAALLTEEGQIYTGCNIENAAYTPTNCAERTAFFKAVSEGERKFKAIAIVGGQSMKDKKMDNKDRKKHAEEVLDYCAPCGVCRQVMMEFCDYDNFKIILGIRPIEYKVYTLRDLFPMGFGPDNLNK